MADKFGEWLSVKEAAELLGCSKQYVHKLMKRGVLRFRPPSDIKVRKSDVIEYKELR